MRLATLLLLLLCAGCGSDVFAPPNPELVFSVLPSATEGAAITPPIQVEVHRFIFGELDSNATDRITISIVYNPGGGTLSGATTVAAVNGVATFPNLSIDRQGEGYVLTAAATGALPDSGRINVACTCWSTKSPMPTGRDGVPMGVVNGVLYAVGGLDTSGYILTTVEAYDPVANSWTTKAPMPTRRGGFEVGVVNGVLYAVGGVYGGLLTTVEAYDPVTNSWTTRAPMPTARGGLAVGVVNGVLYAVGGLDPEDAGLTTVEAYDPVANTWTTKAPMPTPRSHLAVGVVNGLLYAVGGDSVLGIGFEQSKYTTAVEAYDPVANSWTTKAPMPTPRGDFAVGVVNGVLYAVGGFRYAVGGASYGYLATVEAYDPVTNSWTRKGPMLTSRTDLGVGVVNGVLYAVGGFNYRITYTARPYNQGSVIGGTQTTEAYDPAQDR
jgi:N-acetylneuraminic acid mutarotase